MRTHEYPRLPVELPDIQFGGELKEGERYLLTASEVRVGQTLTYLAISVEGAEGPLHNSRWPVRPGKVAEDVAFLHDADLLALHLNLLWQIENKVVSYDTVADLYRELNDQLAVRGISTFHQR